MPRWELVFRLKDSPTVERSVPVQDDSAIRAWQEYQADGVVRPITAGAERGSGVERQAVFRLPTPSVEKTNDPATVLGPLRGLGNHNFHRPDCTSLPGFFKDLDPILDRFATSCCRHVHATRGRRSSRLASPRLDEASSY
jgi:hypothetical protein